MGYDDTLTTPLSLWTTKRPAPSKQTPEERRQKALDSSPADRAEFARTVSIEVDAYRLGNTCIDHLIARSTRSERPGGLWIIGNGGVGKSFILESVHSRYEPEEDIAARRCPVLAISFASRPSESDILLSLLLQLGQDPEMLRYQNNSDLRDIVLDGLKQSSCLAFLFDEAHHLFINARATRPLDRLGGRIGDFIKLLYDDSGMACIFAGTTGLASYVAEDTQASSRWPGVLRLEPFANDGMFRGVLRSLDFALPMPEPAGLAEDRYAVPLYQASKGNFRLLKALVAEAVFLAADEGARRLSLSHLAAAYFRSFCNEETPFGRVCLATCA